MATVSSVSIVREMLKDKGDAWAQTGLNNADWIAGVNLLAIIALKSAIYPATLTVKQGIETEVSSATAAKIRAFVEVNARVFGTACQTGFPFSLLESTSVENALLRTFVTEDSILSQYMTDVQSIARLFQTSANKLAIARALVKSRDFADVGRHLSTILTVRSYRQAVPHFHALTEWGLTHTDIEWMFGCPFNKFLDKTHKSDPGFSKRLHLRMQTIGVHGSLMICVYRPHRTFGFKKFLPHLLAFDMNTEKMVWGVPLTPNLLDVQPSLNPCHASMTIERATAFNIMLKGNQIVVQFAGMKKVRLIEPQTGELHSLLDMLELANDFHLSPEGFTYHVAGGSLIGGQVVDGQWMASYSMPSPIGKFCALSAYGGFLDEATSKLTLVGPRGNRIVIENCLSATARGGKLYLIEKYQNRCRLTIRALKNDRNIISRIEKAIPINSVTAFFGGLCKDGQWILFAKKNGHAAPVFVEPERESVVYSEHETPGSWVINTDSGDIWSQDPISGDIWKTSAKERIFAGNLTVTPGATLEHVDKNGNLYFSINSGLA